MPHIAYITEQAARLLQRANELENLATQLPPLTVPQRTALHKILVELTTKEKPPNAAQGPNIDVFFSQRVAEKRRVAQILTENAALLPDFTPAQEQLFFDLVDKLQRQELIRNKP